MIVLNKCQELSAALHEMSIRIPYEDVRLAATQLIQCAANVLAVRNMNKDFFHLKKSF
jgi:hypothetical protein